jgi:hypothetical protein
MIMLETEIDLRIVRPFPTWEPMLVERWRETSVFPREKSPGEIGFCTLTNLSPSHGICIVTVRQAVRSPGNANESQAAYADSVSSVAGGRIIIEAFREFLETDGEAIPKIGKGTMSHDCGW